MEFAKRVRFALPLVALAAFAQAPSTEATPSQADEIKTLEQKVDQLEQEIKVADRKAEIKAEEDAQKEKTGAHVTADGNGFSFRSNDGDFIFRVGADLQVDNRAFFGPALTTLPDTILLRRARPVFSATVYKYFDFYLRPDFGQGTTVIYDAYIGVNYFKHFKLRAGKFKSPVGLERLQEDDNTTFVERGLPTLLVPSRDIGFQLFGDIIDQRVAYQVGIFNGVPDNGLSDSAASDHRDIAARLFFTPFAPDDKNVLRGLGFGMGATSGSVDGIALPSYKTFGQNAFITFASGVSSDGHRDRYAPQAYYYLGPFGLLTEYGVTEEGFQKGTARHDIAFRAWQVELSYILTGEHKVFGTLTPRKNFDPRNHGWGAVELAVRTGQFGADHGLYNYGFATAATSARIAKEWVGGVNWYLNRIVRTSLDYAVTTFEGGAPLGNRPQEEALIYRLQFNFQSFAQ
jgi:phosphate-selective porin OprO/OprP